MHHPIGARKTLSCCWPDHVEQTENKWPTTRLFVIDQLQQASSEPIVPLWLYIPAVQGDIVYFHIRATHVMVGEKFSRPKWKNNFERSLLYRLESPLSKVGFKPPPSFPDKALCHPVVPVLRSSLFGRDMGLLSPACYLYATVSMKFLARNRAWAAGNVLTSKIDFLPSAGIHFSWLRLLTRAGPQLCAFLVATSLGPHFLLRKTRGNITPVRPDSFEKLQYTIQQSRERIRLLTREKMSTKK
jgi:hypothetical protein